jgi:hypothetical protein
MMKNGGGGKEMRVALRCESPCVGVVTWRVVVGFRGTMPI